jgi:RNA polymerase sigma-70 factor (ECF subfamily)
MWVFFPEEQMLPTTAEPTKQSMLQEFERVFREHYGLIYRTAYAITRKAEDAEDIAQTIFMRLLRRECDPKALRNLKGYLYRASVNASLRTLRSKQREVLAGDDDHLAYASEKNLENDESMDRRLWTAIAELSETAAQAVILRYIEGHSVTETARLLGKSRSVIAVTLFRSRARLKRLIGNTEGEG